MIRKMTLVVAIVVAVALQCAQGQVPTAIQFRAMSPVPVGDASEIVDGPTVVDIGVPIELDLTPNDALLGDRITVTASVTAGTATVTDCATPNAGDFCFVTSAVTFDIGANDNNTITVVIDVFNDNLVEGPEFFTVTASIANPGSQPNGVVPVFVTGAESSTINIVDDDIALLEFTQQVYSVQEDAGSVTVNLRLALNSPSLAASLGANAIQAVVSSGGGSATPSPPSAGADYDPISTVVGFSGGAGALSLSQPPIQITIISDAVPELTETFGLTGVINVGGALARFVDNTAAVEIRDPVTPLDLHLSATVFNAAEGTPTVAVCVIADNPAVIAGRTIQVNIVANPGSATGGGVDYGPITCNPLEFSGTDSQECCNIPINDDNLVEGTESFTVTLTTSAPSTDANLVNPTQATVFIADNDIVTVLLVSMDPVSGTVGLPDVSVPENGLDPRLCVQLTGGVTITRDVTVTLSTVGGTAQVTPPQDYVPISSPITFTPLNQNQVQCRDITVNDDLICEADETIQVALTTAEDPNEVRLSPASATVTIIDNDVANVGFDQTSYTVTEFEDSQLNFNVQILSGQKGPGRSCVVTVSTLPDSATSPADYMALSPPVTVTLSSSATSVPLSIDIVEDLVFEPTEHFNISLSTGSDGCSIPDPIVDVYIRDDEDCLDETGPPCDVNAMCEEFRGRNNFSCTCLPWFVGNGSMCRPERMIGDDPHFSIVLPSGKLLCYTVQGEHGFVFNLISNKRLSMNAMFVPDSRREEVTWLGSMGIVVRNSGYKTSNATYLRFETKGKKIHIGDKVVLEAKSIEKLSFNNGKLTISEAPPIEGFKYPSVAIDLRDVGLNFTIKFMNEHLDLFWHSTGDETRNSHGLIGQFFRKEVEIDTVRKILILPGKEPVPVMRRPVWSFMEREVVDDQLCWTAMNPGYQGQGLIDGAYLDYLVEDVFSTDFKFKKRQ